MHSVPNELIDILAVLIEDRQSIRYVAERARVPLGMVDLSGSPIVIWLKVLKEAIKHDKLNNVIEVVSEHYPNHDMRSIRRLVNDPSESNSARTSIREPQQDQSLQAEPIAAGAEKSAAGLTTEPITVASLRMPVTRVLAGFAICGTIGFAVAWRGQSLTNTMLPALGIVPIEQEIQPMAKREFKIKRIVNDRTNANRWIATLDRPAKNLNGHMKLSRGDKEHIFRIDLDPTLPHGSETESIGVMIYDSDLKSLGVDKSPVQDAFVGSSVELNLDGGWD